MSKTTFADKDEENVLVTQDNDDNTGDALDSFQLGLAKDNDSKDAQQTPSELSRRNTTKRVTF